MWHQPIQSAFRSRSWFVAGVFLCCGFVATAGCGGSKPSGARPATGGAQASGGAPGTGGAGTGGAGTGGAGTGGQAGTAGPGVDPAVSAAWQWTPCGTVAPTVVSATAIAYAPLTEEVAAAYADGRVLLHSVDPATADRVLSEAGPAAVTEIAFSPNGKLLAEARGAVVSLRRLQDGQVLATINGRAQACGTPTQLGFSPDGSRLLGRSAGAICVWRTDSAALVAMATEAFTAAALTNSSVVVGRRLSAGGLAVEALALPSLTRTTIPVQLAAAPALTDPDTLVISPTGDSFAAVVRTGTDRPRSLMLWDGAGAMLVTRPLAQVRPVVFSPDGRHVLLSDAVVNARTGAIEHGLLDMRNLYPPVMLNADGTRQAGLGTIGDIVVPAVSDTVSGIELRVFATLPGPTTKSSTRPLSDMSMSANGQLLATSNDSTLMLFRIAPSFAKSAAIQSANRCELQFRISLSPDGEMLLCSGDGWNLSRTFTGEVVDLLPPPPTFLLAPASGQWAPCHRGVPG